MSAIELIESTFVIKSVKLSHYLDEHGEPWFVGKEVCEYLDLVDTSSACRKVWEDYKGKQSLPTPGGVQEVIVVNELGLYQLIFMSRKEEAVAFQRAVYEMLRTIRRQGYYASPGRDLPIAGVTGKGKHGRQPILDVLRARGLTMARFVRAINQLSLADVATVSDGNFANQAYGGCRVSLPLAIRATRYLNLPADELFTHTSREKLPSHL